MKSLIEKQMSIDLYLTKINLLNKIWLKNGKQKVNYDFYLNKLFTAY